VVVANIEAQRLLLTNSNTSLTCVCGTEAGCSDVPTPLLISSHRQYGWFLQGLLILWYSQTEDAETKERAETYDSNLASRSLSKCPCTHRLCDSLFLLMRRPEFR
jgi:hypothetical protein